MKKTSLLVLLAALAAVPARSEEITWEQCVREALANNPSLSARRLAIEQNRHTYLSGYNAFMPNISLSHSVSRSGGDGSAASTSWRAGVSASETLFSLKTFSSIRSSKLNYEKAEADYRAESASLRLELYSAFVNLLFAQERLAAQEKVTELRGQNARLIKLKYESGMESRGNMLHADALHEVAMADTAKARRSLETARRDLLSAMGTSSYRPLTVRGELSSPEYELDTRDLRALIEASPRIVSQRKSLGAQEERLLSAKYDAAPSLSASQSMSWSGPYEFPDRRSWSLGLSLSVPIFSNGPTYYVHNTASARAALKAAEEGLRGAVLDLEKNILGYYDEFLNAVQTAAAHVKILEASEERYKESQIKYMAGKMSFLDLETIEQNLVSARLNQLEYLKNANTRKLAVENLLGVGLGN
ncbi:MAG: TolC family protein [Elusimicrobiales bacterium]|jgi:outer membrane protein TolC|nr:TolC family protein [Elusimicrobiales bacterium]